jgi:Winged helix DNA-binding domain
VAFDLVAQVRRLVDRVCLLQIDSVNVLARAHYLSLFSRLGPYSQGMLDTAARGAAGRAFRLLGSRGFPCCPSSITFASEVLLSQGSKAVRRLLCTRTITPSPVPEGRNQTTRRSMLLLTSAVERASPGYPRWCRRWKVSQV